MGDAIFGLMTAGLAVAASTFAFCFIGSKSAKNQLAELRDRIEQLETAVGKNNPDSDS